MLSSDAVIPKYNEFVYDGFGSRYALITYTKARSASRSLGSAGEYADSRNQDRAESSLLWTHLLQARVLVHRERNRFRRAAPNYMRRCTRLMGHLAPESSLVEHIAWKARLLRVGLVHWHRDCTDALRRG